MDIKQKRQGELLKMRLDGLSYGQIAKVVGLSRQRVQQLLQPPTGVKKLVRERAKDRCEHCGIWLGESGHVHHNGGGVEDYGEPDKLQCLCPSCHRQAHKGEATYAERRGRLVNFNQSNPDFSLTKSEGSWNWSHQHDERNKLLLEYAKAHPELALREFAEIFHITQARVWQLIHNEDFWKENPDIKKRAPYTKRLK